MGIRVAPAEVARWTAAGLIERPEARPARAARPGPAPGGAAPPEWSVSLAVPGLAVVSRANVREHWAARHRRNAAEAAALASAWSAAGLGGWRCPLPAAVTLARRGGRAMDSDNLAGAFKAVRDALAGLIGADDGDPRLTWHYEQRPGPGPAGCSLTIRGG